MISSALCALIAAFGAISQPQDWWRAGQFRSSVTQGIELELPMSLDVEGIFVSEAPANAESLFQPEATKYRALTDVVNSLSQLALNQDFFGLLSKDFRPVIRDDVFFAIDSDNQIGLDIINKSWASSNILDDYGHVDDVWLSAGSDVVRNTDKEHRPFGLFELHPGSGSGIGGGASGVSVEQKAPNNQASPNYSKSELNERYGISSLNSFRAPPLLVQILLCAIGAFFAYLGASASYARKRFDWIAAAQFFGGCLIGGFFYILAAGGDQFFLYRYGVSQ